MGRRPTRTIDPAALPQAINVNDDAKARAEVTFENQSLLGALFGQFDANLVQLENRLGVFIHARGDKILIEGSDDAVARARDTLNTMYDRLAMGQDLDAGAIEALIAQSVAASNEPTLEGIVRKETSEPPIMIRTRKKTIVPRTPQQGHYMRALVRDDIVFALGPAGTGKTYIAVAQAVSQLITGSVQNTTREQMKMFLTRFGQNSRMVVCGDPLQVDIPGGARMSGLADAVEKLEGVEGFGTIRFTAADVVRHPIVGRIVEAYEGGEG